MADSLETVVNRLTARSRSERNYIAALGTGMFSGFMMVIMTVTYASLIFSGDLSNHLADGIAVGLTSVVVIGLVLTIFSRSSHLVVQIDDDTAPVFALLLSILAASLPATLTSAEMLTNLLAALFIATLVSGTTLAIFGVFKYGNFIQFLPYSVMGGYFTAVGWLLLVGTLSMLCSIEFDGLDNFTKLFTAEYIWRWLPAIIIGVLLKLLSNRFSTGLLLSGMVVTTVIVFYGAHALMGNSPSELMSKDLLIGPFPEQHRSIIQPVSNLDWSSVQIKASLSSAGSVASITLISLLSIILCVSGLSLTTKRDLDINHELKISGFANIASSFFGGMAALPSLSISKLAYEIHPKANKVLGFSAIIVGVVAFYFGMTLISHIPKIVLGALSVYIGLGFLKEWLIDGYRKFGALEYSVIPIILIVTIFAGFLQGVVIGILAAIFLFVIKYSRIKFIRYEASGINLRSNIARDAEQISTLNKFGNRIHVFTLQGYLFFGTAGSLYRQVLESIDNPDNAGIKYVILDFSQVIGVDSSATLNFEKLSQRLVERKIYLITTNLKDNVLSILRRGGLSLDGNAFVIQHSDLDKGLEYCENSILSQEMPETDEGSGVIERISELINNKDNIAHLENYLQKVVVEEGQIITEMGGKSDEVFFLESCTASAYIIDSEGQERRVSGAGRGAVYGEIGFILNIPRTALVRADSKGEIYVLSHTSLREMEEHHPDLATALIRYLAQTVTERLANTTQALRAVL